MPTSLVYPLKRFLKKVPEKNCTKFFAAKKVGTEVGTIKEAHYEQYRKH